MSVISPEHALIVKCNYFVFLTRLSLITWLDVTASWNSVKVHFSKRFNFSHFYHIQPHSHNVNYSSLYSALQIQHKSYLANALFKKWLSLVSVAEFRNQCVCGFIMQRNMQFYSDFWVSCLRSCMSSNTETRKLFSVFWRFPRCFLWDLKWYFLLLPFNWEPNPGESTKAARRKSTWAACTFGTITSVCMQQTRMNTFESLSACQVSSRHSQHGQWAHFFALLTDTFYL